MGTETRIRLLGIVFLAAAVALVVRLFYWQVTKGAELATEGRSQHTLGQEIDATRGNIYASDGSLLAATTQSWTIYASLPDVTLDAQSIASTLAPLTLIVPDPKPTPTADPEATEEAEPSPTPEPPTEEELLFQEKLRLQDLLTRGDVVWVPLRRDASTELKKQVEALEIEGIGFEKTEARAYPEASAAAHLLGFVGKDDEGDNAGYFGLEGYYDLTLKGTPGYVRRESDATGVPLLFGGAKEIGASHGVDLITHVDKAVQIKAEQALRNGIERYGAQSGTVIVMDPRDGGVLAMTSVPGYEPSKYSSYSDEFFRNPAISDAFEPGSIFKPIVMAAGLDAGLVEPDTVCDICGSPYKVDKYFIKTWNNEYSADSTMVDVIKHSDNVGMAFVGGKLGADKMHDYIEAFGFGRPTNIDLQGEAAPFIRRRGTWNIVDLATTSFGQGIAVTPIQMIKAIATIANDGREVTPQAVDKIVIDGIEEDILPEIGENVISKKAADQMTDMMVTAVKDGEAKWTVPQGFKIAGKTGTAQIPVAGHYDDEKTIASFVGFAPANDPKVVMLVTLREPESSPWASETAAPLWFDLALDLFPYFGIQPE